MNTIAAFQDVSHWLVRQLLQWECLFFSLPDRIRSGLARAGRTGQPDWS